MPKIVDHDAQRELILKQSFAVFQQQSYDSLTMRQLAGRLNLSTGSLYHYFDSKEDLFEALIRRLGRDCIEELHQLVARFQEQAAGEPKPGADWFEVIFQALITHSEQLTGQFFLTTDILRQNLPERFRDLLRELTEKYLTGLSEAFQIEKKEAEDLLARAFGWIYLRRISVATRLPLENLPPSQ